MNSMDQCSAASASDVVNSITLMISQWMMSAVTQREQIHRERQEKQLSSRRHRGRSSPQRDRMNTQQTPQLKPAELELTLKSNYLLRL